MSDLNLPTVNWSTNTLNSRSWIFIPDRITQDLHFILVDESFLTQIVLEQTRNDKNLWSWYLQTMLSQSIFFFLEIFIQFDYDFVLWDVHFWRSKSYSTSLPIVSLFDCINITTDVSHNDWSFSLCSVDIDSV